MNAAKFLRQLKDIYLNGKVEESNPEENYKLSRVSNVPTLK